MKPRVYFIILLLLIPFQASLLNPLSFAGVKPDLGLALLYIIGLTTGPVEATLAGMGIGLIQDIGSAGLIGLSGLTQGMAGLAAGLLGSKVLHISSPTLMLFLAAFSLVEGLLIAFFMQVTYGAVPFFSILVGRLVPQAFSTSILGFILLRLAGKKGILPLLKRRALQKEL
ncbi:MAG TPA: hypothetical protein VF903_08530 [Nitrospirota bacterium]